MATKMRLGELLLSAGVVDQKTLDAALRQQKVVGQKLGSVLVRAGALTEDLLAKALSKQLGIPLADLRAPAVPPPLLRRIDRALCERYGVVPIGFSASQRVVWLAVHDPFERAVVDDVARNVGLQVEVLLASESDIRKAIPKVFGAELTTDQTSPASSQAAIDPPGDDFESPPTNPLSDNQGGANLRELEEKADDLTQKLTAVVQLLVERKVLRPEEIRYWRDTHGQSL